MTQSVIKYYKKCRDMAGFTRKEASEKLHIDERTLARYEDLKVTVSEEMVDKMATLYNTPLLAYWHMKNYSPLGKYLPDIYYPQTLGDMGLMLNITEEELKAINFEMFEIIKDFKISENEQKDYEILIDRICKLSGNLMVISIQGKSFINNYSILKGDLKSAS